MRALVAVTLVGLLSGCIVAEEGTTSTPIPGQSPGASGSTAFFLVTERLYVNTTGDEYLEADFGPHCGDARYTLKPLAVELIELGRKTPVEPVPKVLLLWRIENAHEDDGNAMSIGEGLRRFDRDTEATTIDLVSPVDEDRSLARLRVDKTQALLDGSEFKPGEARRLRFSFDVVQDGETFQITEVLDVYNLGRITPRRVAYEGLCD